MRKEVDRFNAKIYIFNKEVKFPDITQPFEEKLLLENCKIKGIGIIKRLVLSYYENPILDIFQNIRVQRANMMIWKVPFEINDKKYVGKFSGYIEFDDRGDDCLEKKLKKIEKTDHCGFLYKSPWKEIKDIIREEAQKFIDKIIPSNDKERKFDIKNLSKLIQKANQIINDHCPELLGTGPDVIHIPQRPKPPVYIKYLYINKREAKFDDIIKSSCVIKNKTSDYKKIRFIMVLEIWTGIKGTGIMKSYDKSQTTLLSGEESFNGYFRP